MGSGGSKHKPGSRSANQPADRPSPPGKPYLVPGSPYDDADVITVGWDPPIILGGSKLLGYVVEHKRTGSPYWVKAAPLLARHNQLSLSGLEPGMRYQFRVTAENAYGRSDLSQISEPFAISYSRGGVAVAPAFSSGLQDTTAIENEKVEFSVKVEGTPTPKISWFKDGFEVFSNRRQRVATDGDVSTLIIHQAALSDEGEVKCTATNKAGHAVTKARLSLEAPPSIRLQRQYEDGLIFELGEVIRLKVAVSGRPQPDIAWFHDGEQLKPDGRIEMAVTDKHALVKIADATRLDRGEYQVTAKNGIGDDSVSFLVTITDRPLPPENVEVVMTLGRCVTLGWSKPKDDGGCMIGNYIVEYYRIGWDMWLKAATCRQLQTTIGDLIEGSEYKFRVKAENPYGVSDPSEESDTVFIPDPKRGFLEPPSKGGPSIRDDTSDNWAASRRPRDTDGGGVQVKAKQKKSDKSPTRIKDAGEWTEDESLPSQVVLAHQVLKKVKLAPQRTWSEDSQGSPPREVPEKRPPVPPKRKHRPPTMDEQVSPPTTPVKKERKLPPHLQKEFERVYAQMGDREPSPDTQAMNRRIKALGKKVDNQQEARISRKSTATGDDQPVAKTRMPSKSPRRRDRESRTPSTVREVTPRGSVTPDTTRPVTPKLFPGDPDFERIAEAQAKKEEDLRRKEEELIRKMEELKRREEEMRLEEERREQEAIERQKKLEEEKTQQKTEKIQWGRELSHDIHSSSEMMLVLLPSNEDQVGDEEPRITADDLKESGGIAPPMSLSAPVLGGSEMPPPSLRAAVSSSEIMYELAMARLNKEADEEEAETQLRVRYGIDRKRSFERRTNVTRETIPMLKDETASMENLSSIEKKPRELGDPLKTESEEEISPSPILTVPSRQQKDKSRTDTFTERFKQLEKNFENYSERFDFDDRPVSDMSDMERSFEYYDDVEEETYHPRGMGAGVFMPIAVQLPSREFAEVIPTPSALGPPPLITINEETERDSVRNIPAQKFPDQHPLPKPPEPKIERVIVRETISPDRLPEPPPIVKRRSPSPKLPIPSEPVDRKLTPSPTNLKPKPILKVRDRSAERSDRSDVSDSDSGTKRVRIEEPRDKNSIDMYAKEENDMGLQAGEVARNRRKAQQQTVSPVTPVPKTIPAAPVLPNASAASKALPESSDSKVLPAAPTTKVLPTTPAVKVVPPAPAKKEEVVVVNIYSDIIREFSHQRSRKPQPKLYLNYDELKQAADKVQEAMIDDLETLEAMAKNKKLPPKEAKTSSGARDQLEESSAEDADKPVSTLPKPKKLLVEYLLDLCLFVVALWLYIFKDPRLSIPIIVLMIYRQLDQTLKAKISSIGSWFRKKEE